MSYKKSHNPERPILLYDISSFIVNSIRDVTPFDLLPMCPRFGATRPPPSVQQRERHKSQQVYAAWRHKPAKRRSEVSEFWI